MPLNFKCFVQYIATFKKSLNAASFSLPDCQPAVRPSCATAMAPVLRYSRQIYEGVVLKNIYSLHHGASFYPLLVNFRFQIVCKNERNL